MGSWIEHIARGPVPAAVILAAVFTSVAIRLAPGQEELPQAVIYELNGALTLEQDQALAKHTVGAHRGSSVHHLLIARGVRAHYHRTHDETVIVTAGEGRMTVGDVTREISAGFVLVIPRSTVHSLEVTGAPVEAISIFSPPFDGEDRHFVD